MGNDWTQHGLVVLSNEWMWSIVTRNENGNSLVDANALILVTLCCYHDVGFIQYENADLSDVENTEFAAPVQHFARRTDDYVIVELCTTRNYIER